MAYLGLLGMLFGIAGCSEDDTPKPQQTFEGATHVIAPQSDYFLEIPDESEIAASATDTETETTAETDAATEDAATTEAEGEGKKRAPTTSAAADGQFAAGTKVKILEKGEKYIKVETFDGTQAYVPVRAVKENTPEG